MQPVQVLKGRIGVSRDYGSGWIDLSPPIDFKKGESLQLTLRGSATQILVRFLPHGGKPDQPVGIVSDEPFEIPKSRKVVLSLEEDHDRITQISVHGGPDPWGISLGEGNGPVELVRVELLANEKQGARTGR